MKTNTFISRVSVIVMTLLAIACGEKTDNDKGAMYTTPHATDGQSTNGDTTLQQIYIYSPSASYTGGLGGMSGADAICKTNRPAELNNDTFEAHAMLNFSGLQTIASMASLQAIPDVAVYAYGSDMKLADNWADLLDGALDVSLAHAGVLPINTIYWTGFNANGVTAQSYCTGFNNGTSAQSGQIGNSDYADGRWAGYQEDICNRMYRILCVAFTQ